MILSNYRPRRGRSRTTVAIGACTIALLATMMGAGAAQAAGPPTVLLGTAGQFAVLAGTGMTNTGTSTINGDVGSSPNPAQPGFTACPAANCVALTGANHNDPNPNDAVTQGAKTALSTAYGDAAGRTPTTVLTELAGQTLVAGVYRAASGTFGMTGTLVLDGANDADSVFIFQTDSTLITGGTGNVTLIRGAQACNIFWKVGSAATLGAGSTLKGTVLAHDDISVGSGATVEGRLLAGAQPGGAGAVTLISDTIVRPSTCASQAAINAAAAAQVAAEQAAAAAAAAAQAAAAQSAAERAAEAQASAAKAAANLAATASAEAARAASEAKAAADTAAAATAAAARAADAANVEAARVAAATAAEAARAAAANAAAATAAAAKAAAAAKVAAAKAQAAKVTAAKAAATKAVNAAKVAAAKAAAARAAAAKAATSAKIARAKVLAAKKNADSSTGFARPSRSRAGFTG
jgi:hypothetical protein